MTKEGKKSLELSLREAVALASPQITSGHLLLGLLGQSGSMDGTDICAVILREAGIDPVVLRRDLLVLMQGAA